MNNPRVSVVIAAFNAEKTIKETIKSALNQSEKSLELIVVNDGSTDNTQKILEEFKNKIKIIQNKENLGAAASRNIGAKNAKAELIAFLDQDTMVESNWLEKLTKVLDKEKEFFGATGEVHGFPDGTIAGDFFNFVISSGSVQGYNIAFRRKEFLEFGGFNEGCRVEDFEFGLRVLFKGKKILKTGAKSFHSPYGFMERAKANKVYSFHDGRTVRNNLLAILSSPLRSMNPKTTSSLALWFYSITFLSWLLAVALSVLMNPLFFLLFFVPALAGTAKVFLARKSVEKKNSMALVLAYAFPALFAFSLIKGIYFAYGFARG